MNSVIARQHVYHDPIYAEEANQARYQGIQVKECEECEVLHSVHHLER
jgi:hypothetical protein